MSRSAVLLVLFAAGCARAPAGADLPPAPAETPPAPQEKENWRVQYGLPEEIEPKNVAFAKPEVGETFLKLDAAARKVAGNDWANRASDRYPYSFWNSGSSGFNQTYTGTWEKVAIPARGAAPRPNHTVRLSTALYTGKPQSAYGFNLRADWYPNTGWCASVGYSVHDSKNGVNESFDLSLVHDELMPAPTDRPWFGLAIGPGGAWYNVSCTDALYAYQCVLSSRPVAPVRERQPLAPEGAKYYSSAGSFRDTALGELDRLEANAKEGIASGKAAQITTKGGPTGPDAPQPVPNKDGVAVPEAIKKDALAEIENRKKLVKDHYKEMHATTVAAFPGLGEILSPPKK